MDNCVPTAGNVSLAAVYFAFDVHRLGFHAPEGCRKHSLLMSRSGGGGEAEVERGRRYAAVESRLEPASPREDKLSPVPFARYTDANREFADSRDGIKYLLIALAFFGMLYVCGKALGTI